MKRASTACHGLIGLPMSVAHASGAAMAWTDVPGHPHVNGVNYRLENQQDRIQAGVKDGQLNAKQTTRDNFGQD